MTNLEIKTQMKNALDSLNSALEESRTNNLNVSIVVTRDGSTVDARFSKNATLSIETLTFCENLNV